MARNLIFLSDGTGNDGDVTGATNVYKLYQRLHNDIPGHHRLKPAAIEAHLDSDNVEVRQITRYDPGVGSGPREWIGRATGRGISRNIKGGYDFLLRFYEPGDRVYLFGFSRGAYTVRSLAGLVGLCGIAARAGDRTMLRDEKKRGDLVESAYRIYKTGQGSDGAQERRRLADAFIAEHGPPEHTDPASRAVHMIGVWDTVRSLGFPMARRDLEIPGMPHRFHDHELSPYVRYAFHALSIDDDRTLFHPTIWNEPTLAERSPDNGYPPQTFAQVWFPGVHGDVGGGYTDDPRLSDAALAWMIDRILAADHPPVLYAPYDRDPKLGLIDDHGGSIHDPRGRRWKRFVYSTTQRVIVRGTQRPGERAIAPDPDQPHARLNRRCLARLCEPALNPLYDPPNLAAHPDVALAREQRTGRADLESVPFRFIDD